MEWLIALFVAGLAFALGWLYKIKPMPSTDNTPEVPVEVAPEEWPEYDNDPAVPVEVPPEGENLPPQPLPSPEPTLAQEALKWEGKDASPKGLAPKELSCAEGVSNIIHAIFPDFPPDLTSTYVLFQELLESPHFKTTLEPKRGCVIISPREGDRYGHAGIFVEDNVILSNDSSKGLMEKNYTFKTWIERIGRKRDLHSYIFTPNET